MNHRLLHLYRSVAVHATADREHEAVIDLLLLMMVSDHHIDEDELDQIKAISEESGFETATFSFDQYFGRAMAKVRGVLADHSVDNLLDDIDGRITSSVLRQSLFAAAREVAAADDEIAASEESLLAQVAARFA